MSSIPNETIQPELEKTAVLEMLTYFRLYDQSEWIRGYTFYDETETKTTIM